MSQIDPFRREPEKANAAQVKDDIDRGLTGDKAPGFDPAAAPLGTDEEAGGAPHDPRLMAAERRAQSAAGVRSRRPNAADPSLPPDGWRKDALVVGATCVLGIAFIAAAVLASAT